MKMASPSLNWYCIGNENASNYITKLIIRCNLMLMKGSPYMSRHNDEGRDEEEGDGGRDDHIHGRDGGVGHRVDRPQHVDERGVEA